MAIFDSSEHILLNFREGDLRRKLYLQVLAGLLAGVLGWAHDARAQEAGPAKVIEIAAKKYEFTPSEIRVKKGERVQLKVHSEDTPHGIKLSEYPEGTKDKSTPGLKFAEPNQNGKAEKNADQVVDFVAVLSGTYEFKCAKLCGMGHGRMKGKLIVEE